MIIKSLTIKNFRKIETLDVQFHEHLTIITGANNTGKTSILNMIDELLDAYGSFINNSEFTKGKIFVNYDNNISEVYLDRSKIVGEIVFQLSGEETTIRISKDTQNRYFIVSEPYIADNKVLNSAKKINYELISIDNIKINSESKQNINDLYKDHVLANNLATKLVTRTLDMRSALISWAMRSREYLEEFQDILKIVLSSDFDLEELILESSEVILKTKTEIYSLDQLSSGTVTIINLAWLIFNNLNIKEKSVVLIDEPEMHLHPKLQKDLLHNFIKAFPNVQFVISSHSPFIITSAFQSNVFVLKYTTAGKAEGRLLSITDKAGSTNEVLREVLDVEVTVPIWVEKKLEEIIQRYIVEDINEHNLCKLRDELKQIGLEKYIPNTIAKVVEGKGSR